MSDYSDKKAEELEKRIEKIYEEAKDDIQEKLDKHLKKFKEKDKEKKRLLKDGKITKEEYIKWREGQVLTGKRWQTLRDQMADVMVNADEVAMAMSKGELFDIFAQEHNFATYEIEKLGIDTSYTLYNADTVRRLVAENPKMLPDPKVDVPKDKRWNQQKITSAVTQGILQGESIPKISKRLQEVTDMGKSAATRNARTMVTASQNAGTLESYKRAESLGIPMMKQWLAAHDRRVRRSHQLLDGQSVRVNEEFSNGLMYPGDPDGAPEEVYNCRCTLVADVDIENLDKALESEAYKGMQYEEWEEEHR